MIAVNPHNKSPLLVQQFLVLSEEGALFTTHRARGSHRGSYGLLDLIGGLLTALVLITNSSWQQRRKVQLKRSRNSSVIRPATATRRFSSSVRRSIHA